MISIDVKHPDVLEFAKIKADKTKVTGANISIRLNDDFMNAVEKDEDYILRFPCDAMISDTANIDKEENKNNFFIHVTDNSGNTLTVENAEYNILYISDKIAVRRIRAKEYWNEFIKQAKDNAEPGLMFWDTILKNDPCSVYPKYSPITSNPCGEQFLQANDSCRLMVHNLINYVVNPFNENAYFDYELFYKNCYEGLRLGDDLVDLEADYIRKIILKIESDPESENIKRQEIELWKKSLAICLAGRRVGMGITALGDTLAALCFKYDSDEALKEIEKIMQTKMRAELDCTTDLAILRGTFEGWDWKLEGYGNDEIGLFGSNPFYNFIAKEFPEQFSRMCKYGRRNVSWSTIAPTGSVSLLAGNCTSGCEPLFSPFYFRKKKINPSDKNARIDMTDQNGDSWQEFPVLHPKLKEWIFTRKEYKKLIEENEINSIEDLSKEKLEYFFKESPYYGSTADTINWYKRVQVQALLQKYTTNAISSTINLPSTVTYEEVSNIYTESWKQGLKGVTVYVDGSRTGVLTTDSSNEKTFSYKDAVKRPKVLACDIFQSETQGEAWLIVVSLLEDKPYEVFCVPNMWDLPKNKLTGELIKEKRGHYKLRISNDIQIENINLEANEYQAVTSRLISTALRHGTNIKFIVEQLCKVNGGLYSFNKSLTRVLKKYIPNNEKSTIFCEECGAKEVVFEEGCRKCLNCGNSLC